mgnify:CR=1 FL=1
MGTMENIEYQGYRMRAMKGPGGDWIGEVRDAAVPQLVAESRDDLMAQFRVVIDSVIEAEAEEEYEGAGPDLRDSAYVAPMGIALTEVPLPDMDGGGNRPEDPDSWDD